MPGSPVLVGKCQILNSGKAADDFPRFILKGHVISPYRYADAFSCGNVAAPAGADLPVRHRFFQKLHIMNAVLSEKYGTESSEHLVSLVSGDLFSSRIEKSEISAPVDGKDAYVKIIKDDLHAALFIVDPAYKTGKMRMILENRETSGYLVAG